MYITVVPQTKAIATERRIPEMIAIALPVLIYVARSAIVCRSLCVIL